MVEPEEIQHSVMLAASVYQDRYATPLQKGVLGRAFRALLRGGDEHPSEIQAFRALEREQRWALHEKAQNRAFAWALIWFCVALAAILLGHWFWETHYLLSNLFVVIVLIGLGLSAIFMLLTILYLCSPSPLKELLSWENNSKNYIRIHQGNAFTDDVSEFLESPLQADMRELFLKSASVSAGIIVVLFLTSRSLSFLLTEHPSFYGMAINYALHAVDSMQRLQQHDKEILDALDSKSAEAFAHFVKERGESFHLEYTIQFYQYALHFAASEQRYDRAQALLKRSLGFVDVALVSSIKAERPDMVDFFLKNEADLHFSRELPLRAALEQGNASVVHLLLKSGANPWAAGVDEALGKAQRAGHREAVRLVRIAQWTSPSALLCLGAMLGALVWAVWSFQLRRQKSIKQSA
jgi:hypothetical protein